MFFKKVKKSESGILLYGITPPKIQTLPERVTEIAAKTVANLVSADIDALIVYDVQDESARTDVERPFPFTTALDPFKYASEYLNDLEVPKVIYRPAGKYTREELSDWLTDLKLHGFFPVFVGLPSPDYVVKTSLNEAYKIWEQHHGEHSVIGAITIPERHNVLKDEETRIISKVECGVSYFISQCIFNLDYTKKMLDDLLLAFEKKDQKLPTIIFTLTICGSLKTLQFMEWLGIHIPDNIRDDLKLSDDPVRHSVELATGFAEELIRYCQERNIPFGFNIESVAIRKVEIEASLELLNAVSQLLTANGLRNAVKNGTEPLIA